MTAQQDEVVQRIKEALEVEYQPERIILFGSYASGVAGKDSDIDLLIIKETSAPFFQRLAQVRKLVSPYRRGLPFDPIVLTPAELNRRLEAGDQFLASVLRSGRELYART